jgi:hypothetical protein
MPSCRRCGRELKQTELSISNWTEVSKKTFYTCMSCGGNWLYSKNLNCPVLIDEGNIGRSPRGGKKSQFKHVGSVAGPRTRSRSKAKGMVKS